MKFEQFNFYKIWESLEGRNIMRSILEDPNLIHQNHKFWAQKFKIDSVVTPSNSKGVASFTSEMREMQAAHLMDMRAPLSDTLQEEKKGGVAYSGSIPEFSARGYVETAQERNYRTQYLDQFADARWIAEFAMNELQRMLDSGNQTLSYQAAQLLSTGKIIYDKGAGIHGNLLKAEIPEENFMTAGKNVWASKTTKIISQMIEIQNKIQDKIQLNIQFQWEITKEMWQNVFMVNEQVLEWANNCRTIETGGIPMPASYALPSDTVKEYLSKYEGLAPIVIIEEKQNDFELGVVRGWKDNIAVYRPVGYAGLIRRSTILDEEIFKKYGNKVNTYNFTEALGGCGVFMNSVIVNGNLKEWHTDFFLKAIPTLDEFLYHYIINTAQADE